MTDLIILGTDTDAGKTTFALLFLAAFADHYAYWKPVETGVSDSGRVRDLVPSAVVHEPVRQLKRPVAPPLAARFEGTVIPPANEIARVRPSSDRPLLIETFGGPLSPLNESELQVELIRRLQAPAILVASSVIGAVGRTLTSLRTLQSEAVPVVAVVLVGENDEFAVSEIRKHGDVPVFSINPPANWNREGVLVCAERQQVTLEEIRSQVKDHRPVHPPAIDRLVERDRQTVWHPYTSLRSADSPLPIVSAQDEFLTLADGRRLIDGISSWWTILHGHRHPRLMSALDRASREIDHVLFAGATHPFAVGMAEELLKTVPWSGGRVFFSDNGSTAVEVSLKMAYQTWCHRGEPQRTVFVGFEGAYHGDTFGAMAVGRDPLFFGRFAPLLFRTEQVPLSPELLDACLTGLGRTAAAVVIEPLVQGAGGMRMYSPDTLRGLYSVARRHGVLFIADEVMTCGRTGTFWAHAQAGIAPDLICAAKTLAGGILPLAVTVTSPEIVAAFDVADRRQTFFHGHSFTAHPLACALALENLKIIATGVWSDNVERVRKFWDRIAPTFHELGGVQNVRVCGTILAMDVGDSTGYLADSGRRMRAACEASGVFLRPLGNVLYALPPVNTTDESLQRIAAAMRAAVIAIRS